MKILYFGKICDEDIYTKKKSKQQPYFIAQYMYEKALYEELINDECIEIDVVSIFQTDYFPKDKLYFSKKKSALNFKYLSFVNLPFFREVCYFFTACIQIYKWNRLNRSSSTIRYLYSSCHFPPVSAAIIIMSKILSIKTVVTFTDLPLFTYSKERIKKMKIYKRLVINPYLKLIKFLQENYDNYILFSSAMNKVVNPKNKPSLIIEGIYNAIDLDLRNTTKRHAIAHAGTLNKEVGIQKILDVFRLVDDKSLELWLIGKGDMVDEIISQSKADDRIKYLGFLSREVVFTKLKEAKLLVNLRNPDDEYTKYSFPSKMFEYMVSGTAVLSTRLEGIPEEYYEYIYAIDEYDDNQICSHMMNILNEKEMNLNKRGKNAQQFILQKKTSKIQERRIREFLLK
jgi:glycosyltransferase involved in cell wall biosynthesis